MPFISWVHEKTHIEKENFTNDSVEVVFEANPSIAEQVKRKVEDLNGKFQTIPTANDTPQIFVLRWGHRPQRDVRLTTHVALTARALCASGFILSDTEDPHIQETVTKITKSWGGNFHFEMGTPWKRAVREWKAKGGVVVHLTAYGENIQTSDVLDRIKSNKQRCAANCWKPKGSRRILLKRSIRLQRGCWESAAFRMFGVGDFFGPLL